MFQILNKRLILALAFVLLLALSISLSSAATKTIVETFISNSTWTVPTGVTSVLVQVTGAGGGSGGAAANADEGAGGGGGGGYAEANISVTAEQAYTITIGSGGSGGAAGDNDGSAGSLTRLNDSSNQINATGGGGGGKATVATGGVGGEGASSFADATTRAGGNGSTNSSTRNSGAGGSAGGRDGPGNSGVTTTAANGIAPYGGVGGAGRTNDGAGNPGVNFGAGSGGGSCDTSCTARAGAKGKDGLVVLTYQQEDVSNFPTIKSYLSNGTVANSVTHTIFMPSSFSEGDLLLVIHGRDGAVTSNVSDASWTELFDYTATDQASSAAYYKIANGTETSLVITVSSTQMSTWMALAIQNAGAPTVTPANGSSTNADPPNHDTGVSGDYLWIATGAWDSIAGFNVTAAPTGFSNFMISMARNIGSATTAIAILNETASSKDPGTFTSGIEQWVASTIAIPYNASGYVVNNLPENLSVVLANDTNASLNETSQSGTVSALVKHIGKGKFGALVNINFSDNINLSSLVVDVDEDSRKSVIHNHLSIAEIVNVSLLVRRVSNSGTVFICPDAETIEQVNTTCPGLVNIGVGETIDGMTVTEASYDGEDYYLVTNISGTGGGEPDASNLIQCIFIQNTTCPSGTTRLIGVENDTHNGYNNSHAQNYSLNTYNYSICCNSTNASITISGACPGNETVIKLSNATNAHIQIGNYSGAINYTNASACLGSNFKRVSCNYPTGSCTSSYACILSMAGSEGDNTTDAHIGSCSLYDQKVCCGLVNSAPTKPTLLYPVNNNGSVFERKINFNWSNVSPDPDGDLVNYTLNVTCVSGSCSGCNVSQPSITSTNYTVTSPLCVDVSYNWTVTACDQYLACNTSTIFNFTIASVADITMVVNSTSFGNMSLNENNNTLDRSPSQLVVQNTGNVMVNVSINATKFFNAALMDTRYYQFEASLNDTDGYVEGCSQTTFADMSNTTQKRIYCNFSYDGMKKANIELNVTVPSGEPGGTKTSSIQLDCVKSE